MKMNFILLVFIFFFVNVQIDCQSVNGKLFVLGGSTKDDSSSIYNALRESSGKIRPKIAVVISAAPSLADGLEVYYDSEPDSLSYEEIFTFYGFVPSIVELAIDNYHTGSSNKTNWGKRNIEKINEADVIFFNGGDQSRHSRSWLNDDGSDSDIMRALRVKYSQGAVIAGSSAGCAIQSDPTFGEGRSYGYYYFNADLKNCSVGETMLDDREGEDSYRADVNGGFLKGFGFLQNGLLDSHFDARGRLGRLVVTMKQTGINFGFGVDENTGLYFHDGKAEVFGSWGVWIVDSSQANFPQSKYFEANNVKLNYLTEGDSYDLNTKVVSSAKEEIEEEDQSPYQSNDIFKIDEILDSAKSLVRSIIKTSVGLSRESDPKAELKFTKNEDTKSYMSNLGFTINNLGLDIKERI